MRVFLQSQPESAFGGQKLPRFGGVSLPDIVANGAVCPLICPPKHRLFVVCHDSLLTGVPGLATEQARQEPSRGRCLLVTLAPLAAGDVPQYLVHMLAAAGPCCLAAHSARDRSAHSLFPFDGNA
jgi:hypothetical protein